MTYNDIFFIFIGIITIIIIVVCMFKSNKEGFIAKYRENNEPWSAELVQRFLTYELTSDTNTIEYDLHLLKKQASPKEVEFLIHNGYWPWPDDLKQEYLQKVRHQSIIKIDPLAGLDYAMKKYNKNAMRELLAWNTKEGQLLLYGITLPKANRYSYSLPDKYGTIQCETNKYGESSFVKKIFNKIQGLPSFWGRIMNIQQTTIPPQDLPKEIPGFQFKGNICNPCRALNNDPDYSCEFIFK